MTAAKRTAQEPLISLPTEEVEAPALLRKRGRAPKSAASGRAHELQVPSPPAAAPVAQHELQDPVSYAATVTPSVNNSASDNLSCSTQAKPARRRLRRKCSLDEIRKENEEPCNPVQLSFDANALPKTSGGPTPVTRALLPFKTDPSKATKRAATDSVIDVKDITNCKGAEQRPSVSLPRHKRLRSLRDATNISMAAGSERLQQTNDSPPAINLDEYQGKLSSSLTASLTQATNQLQVLFQSR